MARGFCTAGCSALSWHTKDGKHLWGRNYDFDRLAEGTQVTFLPRGTAYAPVAGGSGEALRYACAGTGLLLPQNPVLYEGNFAAYPDCSDTGKRPVQPPFLLLHLLGQCATVEEAVRCLEEEICLANIPFLGAVPSLHWSLSDRTGETVVIEPDADGLHIYRNTIGVMINSPSYPWHRTNLLNYAGLRDLDYAQTPFGDGQEQCFSGSGAQGLPGDWSSPSRFVRLAFLRRFALPGEDEETGVSRMFRLFQSAAFPLGAVQVSHQTPATELDAAVLPYDYTVYTGVCCAESLRYYWTTYEGQQIRYLDLGALLEHPTPLQFPMEQTLGFLPVTP